MNRLSRLIFFGNYFYGLCAVALSIEASLQQEVPLNDLPFYLMIFLASVFYYNIAYITEKPSLNTTNERAAWYSKHLKAIKTVQFIMGVALCALALYTVIKYWHGIINQPPVVFILAAAFLFVAMLYYGINHRAVGRFSLRDIGWLKPFFIGFCWAGLVTVLPVIYSAIASNVDFVITFKSILFFIKNFMFISLLCILFDIKDYATDYNLQLKTVVVNLGLRKTIFYIIIPLTLIGWGAFLTYALTQHFGIMKILVNTVPFILLITVAYSLHRRRDIFYYLVIIDGLMLVKALCGIIAMKYF